MFFTIEQLTCAISIFVLLIAFSIPILTLYTTIIFGRNQARLLRRNSEALEMRVLKARLDRFRATDTGGEKLGEEGREEGGRMERLFKRWLSALEEDVAARDEGSSAVVRLERWPAWF